jgi:hypothetical protein
MDGRTVARNLRIIFLFLSVSAFFLVIFHSNIGDTEGAQIWLVFAMIDLLIASTAHFYIRTSKDKNGSGKNGRRLF